MTATMTRPPARLARASVEGHGIVAADGPGSNVPMRPVPFDYFDPNVAERKLTASTKLALDSSADSDMPGHVYGVLAPYGRCILDNKPGCWTVDALRHDDPQLTNAQPHQGDTLVGYPDGTEKLLATANMGGDYGHAPDEEWVPTSSIQSFYENTSTQMARVRYFWGKHGLCFTGVAWPEVVADRRLVAKLEASATSLHARPIMDMGSKLGLVGACFVNQPGLPLRRAASLSIAEAITTVGIATLYDGTDFWVEAATQSDTSHVTSLVASARNNDDDDLAASREATMQAFVPPLAQYTDTTGAFWYRVVPDDVILPDGSPLIIVVGDPEDVENSCVAYPAADLTPTGLVAVWAPDGSTLGDPVPEYDFENDTELPGEDIIVDDSALAASADAPAADCCESCATLRKAAVVGDRLLIQIGITVPGTPPGFATVTEFYMNHDARYTLDDLTALVQGRTVTVTQDSVEWDGIEQVETALMDDFNIAADSHDDLSTADLPDGDYPLIVRIDPDQARALNELQDATGDGVDLSTEDGTDPALDGTDTYASIQAGFLTLLAAPEMEDIDDQLRRLAAASIDAQLAGFFDEAKHPRNHGKFSSQPGASGSKSTPTHNTSQPSGSKSTTPTHTPTHAPKSHIPPAAKKPPASQILNHHDPVNTHQNTTHLTHPPKPKHGKGGAKKKPHGGKGAKPPAAVKPPASYTDAQVAIPGHGKQDALVKSYGSLNAKQSQIGYVSKTPGPDGNLLIGLNDADGKPVPGFVPKSFTADQSGEAAKYVESEQRRLHNIAQINKPAPSTTPTKTDPASDPRKHLVVKRSAIETMSNAAVSGALTTMLNADLTAGLTSLAASSMNYGPTRVVDGNGRTMKPNSRRRRKRR